MQIFSHSFEQSLRSTLPATTTTTATDTSHDCTANCTNNSPLTASGYDRIERKERSATINCPALSSRRTTSNHYRHRGSSNKRRRPLSLPHTTTSHTEKRNHYLLSTTSHDNKRKHKKKHHCSTNNNDDNKYITLGQLKELGLTYKTSDGLILGQQHSLLTHSSMEQLCYLGPTPHCCDDDSTASNMAVADYDIKDTPTVQKYIHLHSSTSIKIENNYLLSTTEQ